jgi:RNA polymerase sigma-70 factor (ECF subfamily)
MEPGPAHQPVAGQNLTESALADERGGGGDVSWDFEAAVERYQSPLLRYVNRVLGSGAGTDEAEDVVQESLFRLHQQVQRYGLGSIDDQFVWLGRVAYNLAIDTGRKRTRRRKANQEMTSEAEYNPAVTQTPVADPAGALAHRELCHRAMAEVKNLPPVQREAILLRVVEGLTMQQIADLTDTSASNVCYRLSQGLATLSRSLKRQGLA